MIGRKLLSWIVDTFYPEHFFFHKDLFSDVELPKQALCLAFLLSKNVPNIGDEYEVKMKSVTNKGCDTGGFVVTVKRIDLPQSKEPHNE